MSLSPSTWRLLGLSVATGYVGLGSIAAIAPTTAAKALGVYPQFSAAQPQLEAIRASERSLTATMALLAARDISIGVALFALDAQQAPRAMGTVILSGMILCVVDVVCVFKLRGWRSGSVLLAGATSWAVIGLGLVQR